jgi:hypothetical protein
MANNFRKYRPIIREYATDTIEEPSGGSASLSIRLPPDK